MRESSFFSMPVGAAISVRAIHFRRLSALQPAHFPGQSPGEHFPRVAELLVAPQDCRCLIARMYHAVFTAWIPAMPVFLPRSVLDEPLECFMMRVRHQI